MNKKAQSQYNVGTIFIGLGLFALLLMGGFNFYMGYMHDNDVTLPDGFNQTDIDASFARFDTQFDETSGEINRTKSDLPVIGGVLDFFANGIDSIKTAWDSIGFMGEYVGFVRKNTKLGLFLPDPWWNIVISMFLILLVLIGISAFWRYNIAK